MDDIGRAVADEDWGTLTIDPIMPGIIGTYVLTFPNEVRIWQQSGGTFSYLSSGVSWSASIGRELFVEGFSENGGGEIKLEFESQYGDSFVADRTMVKSTAVYAQLATIYDNASSDIFNSPSARLPHAEAIDKDLGAYIPINSDDDDYDGAVDSDSNQTLSSQENDLLPVYVKRSSNDKGDGEFTYKLTSSSSLRIWREGSEGFERLSSNEFSFPNGVNELTFYIDAKDRGNSLTVAYRVTHVPTGKYFPQVLRVNAFSISGPSNVPDYSVYEYKAEGVSGRSETQWVQPGGGEIREADGTPSDPTDSARIFWNESPKIAKARYQATEDYVWARDINVVQIVLGESEIILDHNSHIGVNPTSINSYSKADVPAAGRAFEASQSITSMTGPKRGDNRERGVEKMLVGFIQVISVDQYQATYDGGKSMSHAMQGHDYVDVYLPGSLPWYDELGNSTPASELTMMTGEEYLDGAHNLMMTDSPSPFFAREHVISSGFNHYLQTASWQWNFETIVAVGTTEARLEDRPTPPDGPGDRYAFFRRAEQTWLYHGSIEVQNGSFVYNSVTLTAGGTTLVEVQDGELAFEVGVNVRGDSEGEPIVANNALNNGAEGGVTWVP